MSPLDMGELIDIVLKRNQKRIAAEPCSNLELVIKMRRHELKACDFRTCLFCDLDKEIKSLALLKAMGLGIEEEK